MGCQGRKPKVQKFGRLRPARWFAGERQWVLDRIEEVKCGWARELFGNVDVGELVC